MAAMFPRIGGVRVLVDKYVKGHRPDSIAFFVQVILPLTIKHTNGILSVLPIILNIIIFKLKIIARTAFEFPFT
jgi:hypothetical protein